MVARIREEGLQRARVMDFEGYIVDVLGARRTNAQDMQRAQRWVLGEMTRMGLANVAAEPYMDYGVTWDNEYVSLHMLATDYQPMVGYPIAHTPGTHGKQVIDAVIVDLMSRDDLPKYREMLKGKAVLATPAPLRTVPNPNLLTAVEKMAFYRGEGVAVVLQSESGWLGTVRGDPRHASRRRSRDVGRAPRQLARELECELECERQRVGSGGGAGGNAHPQKRWAPGHGAGQYRGVYLQGKEFARAQLTAWMGPFRRDRISRDAPVVLAQSLSGGMVKAVVDAERYVMVVGAELHPDEQVRARIRDVVSRLVAD